jgi:hypothetical protein
MARALGLLGLGLAVASAAVWIIAPIFVSSVDGDAAANFDDHRALLLAFGLASAGGNALHIVFFAGLRSLVRGGALEETLARIGLLCLVGVSVIVLVAFAIFPVLAFGEPSPETADTLTDLGWFLINQAAGPLTTIGLITLTAALARSGVVRGWALGYAAVAGAAHLVVACTVATSGAFTPAGPIAFAVPFFFFAWFAVIGWELVRPSAAGAGPRAAPGTR